MLLHPAAKADPDVNMKIILLAHQTLRRRKKKKGKDQNIPPTLWDTQFLIYK